MASSCSSPIATAVAAAMRAAFLSLSSRTESRLAEYGDRVRLQARTEAIARVDNAALENARRVAGPVLEQAASVPGPSPALRMAAVLADATLRDELLAPGFLTPRLAERVRAARTAGAQVTVAVEWPGDEMLSETARRLFAAALVGLAAGDRMTLSVYAADERYPAFLILHMRGRHPDHATLRRTAEESGALVSQLDDCELVVRFQPAP